MYTKGKWSVEKNRSCLTIRSEFGLPVADMWKNGDSAEDTAARIVQCVNGWDALKQSHDELVAALELAEKYLVDRNIDKIGVTGRTVVLPAIRVALAKAKEVTK